MTRTQYRVDPANQSRRVDASGRAQFVRKSTRSEIDRRDVLIAKLWRRGHSTTEICAALNIGPSLLQQRVRALGLFTGKRPKGRGPVTEPCPWRDEDMPPSEHVVITDQQTRWRQSRIVGMAQMLNDEYRESNFSNILANQVTDAGEADDRDWLMEALATVNAAIEKLERARRVLTDDHYRVLCRDTMEGVEQMRRITSRLPTLRAVP